MTNSQQPPSSLNQPAPILILGGGLMGLAIAHQLARRGQSVTVISRRRSEAAGFVAAGMLAPHAEGLSGALLQLGQLSLGRVPSWVAQIEADSGLPCGLRTTGIVVPFRSPEERDHYPTAPFGEPLDRAQLHQEIPGLAQDWAAGLLFSQDGQIDNRRQLMRALESACVDRGVHFQEGVEVLELLTENQQLQGVHTRNSEGMLNTLRCRKAVLCSGAWSAQLLPELPMFPVKGQMLSADAAGSLETGGLWPRHLPRASRGRPRGGRCHLRARCRFQRRTDPPGTDHLERRHRRTASEGHRLASNGALVGLPSLHTGRRPSAWTQFGVGAFSGLRTPSKWCADGQCHSRTDGGSLLGHAPAGRLGRSVAALPLESLRANKKPPRPCGPGG